MDWICERRQAARFVAREGEMWKRLPSELKDEGFSRLPMEMRDRIRFAYLRGYTDACNAVVEKLSDAIHTQ